MRSPRPERPVERLAARAERAAEARELRKAARDQRGRRARAELAARARCRPRSRARSSPRRRSRRRARRSCDRAGTSASRARARALRRSLHPRRRASRRSAGRAPHRRRSSGRRGSPGRAPEMVSAMISVMKRCVPRSMPLAQATTGTPALTCGASAIAAVRRVLRRHGEQHRVGARHVGDRAGRGDAVVKPDAGQARVFARGWSVARPSPDRAPTASRRVRRAPRSWRAPCPMRRRRPPRCAGSVTSARASPPRPLVAVERPARARREVERVGQPAREPLAAGPGDHRAVVGAQLGRRRDQHGGLLGRHAAERAADRLVDRDAAGDDQRGRPAEALAERCAGPRAAGRSRRRPPPAGTRRRGPRRPGRSSGATFSASMRSAVFSPESEKSASARPSIGRGRMKRSGSPCFASRSTSGPPG